MKNTKLILKHKNNTLAPFYREEEGLADRLICEHILESSDKVNINNLDSVGKLLISISTGLATYMVDGYENENKHLYFYPTIK